MTKILELGETLFLIAAVLMIVGVWVSMYVSGWIKNSKILKKANKAELREGLKDD